jgi:transposase-like protein
MAEPVVTRRYSIAFRRHVVADIKAGKYTVFSASRVLGITYSTVQRWWKQETESTLWPQMMRIQMPSELERLKQLETEKRALESALAQAQLKIITLEATVAVLEEREALKKKTGTPSSPKSFSTKR